MMAAEYPLRVGGGKLRFSECYPLPPYVLLIPLLQNHAIVKVFRQKSEILTLCSRSLPQAS